MAYNRIEPPYSSGTRLTCPGPERGTPAGGTLCMVPRGRARGSKLSSIILDDQPQGNTHTNGRNIRTHPFGSITSRNQHPTLPLTEKLSLERLNRMAYNRSEPPYSPGTHLKHRGREEATPAGGTACSFPPAGVAEQLSSSGLHDQL